VKKFLKWTGFVVAGIALVALLVASWVYLASEREFNRRYEVAESPPLVIPTDMRNWEALFPPDTPAAVRYPRGSGPGTPIQKDMATHLTLPVLPPSAIVP